MPTDWLVASESEVLREARRIVWQRKPRTLGIPYLEFNGKRYAVEDVYIGWLRGIRWRPWFSFGPPVEGR